MGKANSLVERVQGRMSNVYEVDDQIFCYRSHPSDDWPPPMSEIVPRARTFVSAL